MPQDQTEGNSRDNMSGLVGDFKEGGNTADDSQQADVSTEDQGNTPDESQQASTNPRAEDGSPETESAATTEEQATSEQTQESEQVDASDQEGDDQQSAEDDSPWYQADEDSPFDTTYTTPEEAKDGIKQKDEYIAELRTEREQLEEQAQERINELQNEREQLEARLNQYTSQLPEEQFRSIMIQEYLPDEYKDVSEDEIEDQDKLREYYREVSKAEAKLERELEEVEQDLEQSRKTQEQARQQAINWVEETANPDFFGATNPEHEHKIQQQLNSQVGESEYTTKEVAVFITEAFGEEAGEQFLQGINADFRGNSQEKVQETVKETKSIPENENPAPKQQTPNQSPRDMVRNSMDEFRKSRRR